MNDIQARDAQIAYILADESGNIVVTHQQQIHRHVFAITKQLVLALREFQAATSQQIERVIGKTAGFLQCNFDALLGCVHGMVLSERRFLFGRIDGYRYVR